MKDKKVGLELTQEIRRSLHLAVEEAIKCHFSSLEREYHKREKDARKNRIKLYEETVKVYDAVTENTAEDLLFAKYSLKELVKRYKNWKNN